MKIFISYARVDKPVCIQLVNTLGAHEVWYDQRLYAGQHWWKEILRRLEWCDIFIYLLSKDSIDSEYCQKELEIAQKLGREVIPVLIDSAAEIPADLEEVQYVDMSNRFDVENVTMLHNSILVVERDMIDTKRGGKHPRLQTGELRPPVYNSIEMISQAAKAYEKGEYDQAILLLNQAKAKGFKSRFINIEKMREAAEKAVADQTRRREAEREYRSIMELFQYPRLREFACDAFEQYLQVYPEYDPEKLGKNCTPETFEDDTEQELEDTEYLPMLKWCKIPGGMYRVANTGMHEGRIGEHSVNLPDYYISKYPVTNLQFQHFINAEDGYFNKRWWKFSDYATAWFEGHPDPLPSRFQGDDRPRENVNWYEAIAFTRWLSHTTGRNITLPYSAQWQRAAQGDDDRFYPWGNVFNESRCNTYESAIKSTTSVGHYDDGASPFGVFDMAGNVWEWCLNKGEAEEGTFVYKRAVIGGSFVSPADRAQISFRYYLKPEVRYSSIGIRLVCLPESANVNP